MTVEQCMNREVIVVSQGATLTEALKLMFEHNVSALPVINERRDLVGFIAKGDILSANKGLWPKWTVKQVMIKNVHYSDAGDLIKEALGRMIFNKVNRLPVVEKGKVVGILTRDDLIKHFYASETKEMG